MHRAQAGAVVELRWQQNVARFVFFLQTAHGCDGNDPSNIESTQGINVGAVVQFVRKNSVAPPMSRQKVDLPSVYGTADECIGWRAEWSVDFVLGRIAQLFHLIQTTPADYPNCRCAIFH